MGWRAKFVSMLVVYFAGFATAIYCLAPAPDQPTGRRSRGGFVDAALKSDELARSVNSGMHKAIDLGKEAAAQAAQLIREKVDQAQLRSKR